MDQKQIQSELAGLCAILKKAQIDELTRQGHRATGALIDSVDVYIKQQQSLISIIGSFAHYGPYVDRGRRPGGKRVPLDALVEWIKVKQIDLRGKSQRSVAFAIQTSIWKHGIPTSGSMDKKRFMSGTLERNETVIFEMISRAFQNLFEGEIFNMVEKANQA